jgi:hypothetical protein
MEQHGGMAMTRLAGGVMRGTDAWSREARQVQELATRLGLALDEDELVLQDVHDLQVMGTRLHQMRARQSRTIWAARWPWMARAGSPSMMNTTRKGAAHVPAEL